MGGNLQVGIKVQAMVGPNGSTTVASTSGGLLASLSKRWALLSATSYFAKIRLVLLGPA